MIGSLVATIHATEVRVRIDSPRSPVAASPSQRRYCTGSGALRPYFSRISSSPAASASVPASTRAGSPGIIRTPVKTIRLMRSSVTAEMNARRTRNSITLRYCQAVPFTRISPSGTALYPLRFLGKATM